MRTGALCPSAPFLPPWHPTPPTSAPLHVLASSCSQARPCLPRPSPARSALQNPEAYKVREEIARHERRIRSGEAELTERRRRAEEQGARVSALRDQLEALQDAQARAPGGGFVAEGRLGRR